MVFQDYELIPTKRVNKSRRNTMSPFFNRLWLASGSYSTLYLASLGAYAGILYKQMNPAANKSLMMRSMLPVTLFEVGLIGGIFLFGETREFFHLLRNYRTYRKEFKMIKSELYYN